jgi:hypothetical protein
MPSVPFRSHLVAWFGAALLLAACAGKPPAGPSRELVLALLQKEAEAVKAEGERMDPKLGISAAWTVEGVDVVAVPNDPQRPFRGTIRYRVVASMHDAVDGTVKTERQQSMSYAFDVPAGKWVVAPR